MLFSKRLDIHFQPDRNTTKYTRSFFLLTDTVRSILGILAGKCNFFQNLYFIPRKSIDLFFSVDKNVLVAGVSFP